MINSNSLFDSKCFFIKSWNNICDLLLQSDIIHPSIHPFLSSIDVQSVYGGQLASRSRFVFSLLLLFVSHILTVSDVDIEQSHLSLILMINSKNKDGQSEN